MTAREIFRLALRIPEYLAGAMVLVLTALVNVEVALRYFLNMPVAQVDEVVRLLFVWISFLGAAVAVGKGAHMSLEFLQGRLSPRLYLLLGRLSILLVIAFGAYLAVDGVRFEGQAFASYLTITGWSTGWQFLVVPLSGALMVLYGIQVLLEMPRAQPVEERLYE